MLKVLQLIPTLDRSGAEKQMVLLAKGLPRDRFRVEVATLTRLGPLEAELRRRGDPGHGRSASGSSSIRWRWRAWSRFLKAGRFDVVQTWIFAANTYGRVAARLAGVPVVVTAEMAVDLWKGRAERWRRPPAGDVERPRGGQLARGGRFLPQASASPTNGWR